MIITTMPYQIFMMLIVVDILTIRYSFMKADRDYYTDIITAFMSVIISFVIAYNALIGVGVPHSLAALVQYDITEYAIIGMIAGMFGLLMLIFATTKILDITHTETVKA